MNCPHCHSFKTTQLKRTTNLGYPVYRCKSCQRTFNERTGTPFNYVEVPTDILFQVLLCRVRYKLSYRDVAEFFLLRGFEFTHEAVREWQERFAPIFGEELRAKRSGKVGSVWFVDETYIKVKGRWCYLYRAIDQKGNLVNSMLSQKRDLAAAKAFFEQALTLSDPPEKVVTDGLSSYPRAMAETLGSEVEHEVRSCVTNPIEQSHRGVKHRYYPTLGFGKFKSAQSFCRAVDEVRQFFRPREWMAELVSLAEQRSLFIQRVEELRALFQAA